MVYDRLPGSFRDPSGFLYWKNGVLLRQINDSYAEDFAHLNSSGLYAELVSAKLLISHSSADDSLRITTEAHRVIQPELIRHISHPYEWSFSQLKDAALLTLEIQKRALDKGMTLKDSSAYNVQFHNGQAIFIDTLSFEKYVPGTPWVAYRQFCQHFLAPLALMVHVDVSLNQLFRTNIDGIPLQLATSMLPWKTRFSPGLQMHLWLHARSQANASRDQRSGQADESKTNGDRPARQFSRTAFLGLIDSLTSVTNKLNWKPGNSEWFDYYQANNNYGEAGLEFKENLVKQFVTRIEPATVWDLGGNTGRFSRIAAAQGASVVCWDIDPGCVDSNYRKVMQEGETGVLPLLIDLANPSPALGWANTERPSISDRGPVDMILALGLIHHLAISNNVPLEDVAEFIGKNCSFLLIEFVPRGDGQIDKLLQNRRDIFSNYTPEGFESAFGTYFELLEKAPVPATKRTLYLMKTRCRNQERVGA